MGLSASQAKLLSLTSRMADLELQSQQISNAKTRLSDQSNNASKDYSNALNKQLLKVYSGLDDNGKATYSDATAYNLTNYNAANSISDIQRFIKNEGGDVIISDNVASAYNGCAGDTETFLNLLGYSGYETEYAKAVEESTPYVETFNADLSDLAITSVVNVTTTYQTALTTDPTSFTTAYNDASVHSYLANNCVITPGGDVFTNSSNGATAYGYTSDGSANVINFNDDDQDRLASITNAVSLTVSDICGDTAQALNAIFASQYGSRFSYIASYIYAAESYAASMTNAYYTNLSSNSEYMGYTSYTNAEAISDVANSTGITDDDYYDHDDDEDQQFIDATQVVKMYLNYFDAACADYGDDLSRNGTTNYSAYTNRIPNAGVSSYIVSTPYTESGYTYYHEAIHYDHYGAVSRPGQGGTGSTPACNTHSYYITTGTTYITTTTWSCTLTKSELTDKLNSLHDTLTEILSRFTGNTLDSKAQGDFNVIASMLDILQAYEEEELDSDTSHSLLPLLSNLKSVDIESSITGLITKYDYAQSSSSYYVNVFNEIVESAGGNWTPGKGYNEVNDKNINDPDWLQHQIDDATLFLYLYNQDNKNFEMVSWKTGDNTIFEDDDDEDISLAEAEYESQMNEISAKDKKYDLELENIDTEHSAIKTEVETVKKVIEKNIESSFKMFDA